MRKPTLKRVIPIVREMLRLYKDQERMLEEINTWRNEVIEKYGDIPEHKKALRKLNEMKREVLKMRRKLEDDVKIHTTIFEYVYYIFKMRKIKKFKGKNVFIWLENDESIHFEFDNGSVVITRDGKIIIL
ncbi:MAG: hypothetical protein ABIL49_00440 [candidate division WOR-3 bacterium]|jgi:hypothetical protein